MNYFFVIFGLSLFTKWYTDFVGPPTLIIPFLEIGRVNYQELKISPSDCIIFTSKNAANFFRFEKQFRNNLVFSVGSETKKILQEKGFQNIINADENLEKLGVLGEEFGSTTNRKRKIKKSQFQTIQSNIQIYNS